MVPTKYYGLVTLVEPRAHGPHDMQHMCSSLVSRLVDTRQRTVISVSESVEFTVHTFF